jgi:hypothetical protein
MTPTGDGSGQTIGEIQPYIAGQFDLLLANLFTVPVIGYFGSKTTDLLNALDLETTTFTGADVPAATASYQTWIDAHPSYTIIRTHAVGLYIIVEYYAT